MFLLELSMPSEEEEEANVKMYPNIFTHDDRWTSERESDKRFGQCLCRAHPAVRRLIDFSALALTSICNQRYQTRKRKRLATRKNFTLVPSWKRSVSLAHYVFTVNPNRGGGKWDTTCSSHSRGDEHTCGRRILFISNINEREIVFSRQQIESLATWRRGICLLFFVKG